MTAPEMSTEGTLSHRGHQVWWGRAESPGGTAPPLLTVHGGPGMPHDCLEPLAALRSERPVVFYDQYGCGRSDRAADPSEYDVELFVDELATVRDRLAPGPVHLFAHSYGGPLLLEYLLRRRPADVLSVTLSNTFPSVAGLSAGWDARLSELDPEHGKALRDGPSGEAYGPALGEFVSRFILPGEMPEPLVRAQMSSGGEVYERMHGSSWFSADGQWSAWDATGRLATLEVPTLVVGGTRDQCVPSLAATLASSLPHAELVVLEAGHMPFFEVGDAYLGLLRDFLAGTESGSPDAGQRRIQSENLRHDVPE
ncbi:proline iminopeptidase-family hydrolase [Amycolatopsis australiensis]|uniref:Proline iminopeptidase n=1 Tax=Amycolatopsis australiensis TaxID=546364 RepID=A0A1K1SQC1_9PSEU|nr:proline iminopeptidase-family hydrolase [Amycolatopsis australiensis]SFW86608.1 tricorn interacting aminopeptidase F1. Serine peptidase. MEROPS family S33 [Amycolatopsis australiensis]